MPAYMDEPPVFLVIERHRAAFSALEKHVEIVDQLHEDSEEWASGQLELSRLEDEVTEAASAMTTVQLSSIAEVVSLLSYVEDFSSSHRGGYLLWPENISVSHREVPWSFALFNNIRARLGGDITK